MNKQKQDPKDFTKSTRKSIECAVETQEQWLQFNRKMPILQFLSQIHKGVFGSVQKMYDSQNKRLVAVKRKVKNKRQESRETDQLTFLRKCDNVVNVQDVFQTSHSTQKDSLIQNIVMEYLPLSLQTVMDEKNNMGVKFSSLEVKCIQQQILNGLREMHQKNIAHRDMKPDNILMKKNVIDKDTDTRGKKTIKEFVPQEVKIADVGCAKALKMLPISCEEVSSCTKTLFSDLSEDKSVVSSQVDKIGKKVNETETLQTPHCVSLWYRPPELLAGMTNQTTQIDMWAVGCMLQELQTLQSLFKAESEGIMMAMQFELLGTPNQRVLKKWKAANPILFRDVISRLPVMRAAGLHDQMEYAMGFAGMSSKEAVISREELKLMLDLTQNLLNPDFEERFSAEQAMAHAYFNSIRHLFPNIEDQLNQDE